MSNQNITSDLLVELSTNEQQLLSGGKRSGGKKPIICYVYEPYRETKVRKPPRDRGNIDFNDDGSDSD
ncbi:hypothetical protein PN497_16680 [Sphaerospermopsis kisseleviana CS-549]|uniref:Uncharacterized protein n=1 Tax=Sphaerospermopsis kisseleviana CS-549 TaxID=3021783 RepID=A0ABT4ZUN7_9CYAN|nr:hypothetical protein [Sphaerospermopsis kisseleviana]MDB9442984.1 hypothetical protein [Sphaerospermopsis kisseleviana CS-549]BAZ81260.1 hypothetical protein NIES73_25270 [Sphaerospermopsis kisseleviana NIES-73]